MNLVSIEELEELALDAKEAICGYADDCNTDIYINVVKSETSLDSYHATVTEDGFIYASEERFFHGGNEVNVAIVFDDEHSDDVSDAQLDKIAAVVAVLVNALDVELDDEHVVVIHYMDLDEKIIERAEWYIDNGFDFEGE